jgi:hypothetical protein
MAALNSEHPLHGTIEACVLRLPFSGGAHASQR